MRYRVNSPQVINETIDGEAIMINLATGAYYSLDRTGGDAWALLEQGASRAELVAALEARYEAPRDDIERGVQALLDQLSAEELIVEAGDGGATPTFVADGDEKAPFSPPRLDKFTDMQDLILLDPVHEVDSRGWPHTVASPDAG